MRSRICWLRKVCSTDEFNKTSDTKQLKKIVQPARIYLTEQNMSDTCDEIDERMDPQVTLTEMYLEMVLGRSEIICHSTE